MSEDQHEKYFFNKSENIPASVDEEILKKALKLKRASELGDNKKFASEKYNEFLMDNHLESSQVLEFEKRDIKKQPSGPNKKTVEVNGISFDSYSEFVLYYEKLSFPDKLKVMMQILKGNFKK